jgi:hypothetical protein
MGDMKYEYNTLTPNLRENVTLRMNTSNYAILLLSSSPIRLRIRYIVHACMMSDLESKRSHIQRRTLQS